MNKFLNSSIELVNHIANMELKYWYDFYFELYESVDNLAHTEHPTATQSDVEDISARRKEIEGICSEACNAIRALYDSCPIPDDEETMDEFVRSAISALSGFIDDIRCRIHWCRDADGAQVIIDRLYDMLIIFRHQMAFVHRYGNYTNPDKQIKDFKDKVYYAKEVTIDSYPGVDNEHKYTMYI